MDRDVFVLLLGATDAAYALGAAFAGDMGISVTVMDEELPDAFFRSAFLTPCRTPGLSLSGILRRALSDFYEKHASHRCILIPTTEVYASLLRAEESFFSKMYLLPHLLSMKCENIPVDTDALLLVYTGREGERRVVYGTVAAKTPDGAPLAVLTEDAPASILSRLPDGERGLALFALSAGKLLPCAEDGALSPLFYFISAADASVAEWIVFDYVLCEPLPPVRENARALFSLFPFGKIKRYLLPHARECAHRFHARRLESVLFSLRYERKSLPAVLCLRRFYGEKWEKRINAKK